MLRYAYARMRCPLIYARHNIYPYHNSLSLFLISKFMLFYWEVEKFMFGISLSPRLVILKYTTRSSLLEVHKSRCNCLELFHQTSYLLDDKNHMLNPDTEEDKAIGLETIAIIVLGSREEYFISISWSLQQIAT